MSPHQSRKQLRQPCGVQASYLKELVVAQARAVASAGFGGFSSTTRHFPSMRSTSPRSASLPRRMLTVLVLEPTRRASSATPAFGAARIASSKRPSEALTSSGVGRFHSPMSFRRDERGGVRAAGNAGGRGSFFSPPPPPPHEGSDNLSNGRRRRDDGSEGVANSDQIVGVHLIPAGGDGRSIMPPRGGGGGPPSPSSRTPGHPVGWEGRSRARSSTLLSTG